MGKNPSVSRWRQRVRSEGDKSPVKITPAHGFERESMAKLLHNRGVLPGMSCAEGAHMKVRTVGLGIVLAGFTLVSVPALAQDPKGGGGAPGGGASERTGGGGAAANNGGGGGGSVGSAGGSVATGGSSSSSGFSGGGSAFGSPSGSGAAASNLSFAEGARGPEAAPAHRAGFASRSATAAAAGDSDQKAQPRTASGSGGNSNGGGGERAVPRGSSAAGSGSRSGDDNNTNAGSGARSRPASSSEHNASNENNASSTREVPTWSRPRGDRPATGVAVDRVAPPPTDHNGGGYNGRYDPYYGYGGYGGYNGYYGYNPYGYYGYYSPYAFGLGYGLYSGYGWGPYFGDPSDPYYGGGGGSGSYSSGVYNTHDQRTLKLKVKPRNAKVYVDGYLVGNVDQFGGAFQKLTLNGGRHKVEVRAEGFETAEFDVLITPDQTVTFQGELKRTQ